jgi:DNA-binding MarR family transcriptional regulator
MDINQVPSLCIGMHVRRASRIITQIYDEALRPLGLQLNQFTLLASIKLLGSTAITRLAEVLFMDQTTLTRNLKPLEKRGLIVITPGEDRRVRVVCLTHEGHMLLDSALPLWEKAQNRITEKFGAQQARELLSILADTTHLSNNS